MKGEWFSWRFWALGKGELVMNLEGILAVILLALKPQERTSRPLRFERPAFDGERFMHHPKSEKPRSADRRPPDRRRQHRV